MVGVTQSINSYLTTPVIREKGPETLSKIIKKKIISSINISRVIDFLILSLFKLICPLFIIIPNNGS